MKRHSPNASYRATSPSLLLPPISDERGIAVGQNQTLETIFPRDVTQNVIRGYLGEGAPLECDERTEFGSRCGDAKIRGESQGRCSQYCIDHCANWLVPLIRELPAPNALVEFLIIQNPQEQSQDASYNRISLPVKGISVRARTPSSGAFPWISAQYASVRAEDWNTYGSWTDIPWRFSELQRSESPSPNYIYVFGTPPMFGQSSEFNFADSVRLGQFCDQLNRGTEVQVRLTFPKQNLSHGEYIIPLLNSDSDSESNAWRAHVYRADVFVERSWQLKGW